MADPECILERGFEMRAKPGAVRSHILLILMQQSTDTELNRALDRVTGNARSKTFRKSAYSAAPFVRAIPELSVAGADSGAE